jgi:hypothetical protein
VLTFFAEDAKTHTLPYANTDVPKAGHAGAALIKL